MNIINIIYTNQELEELYRTPKGNSIKRKKLEWLRLCDQNATNKRGYENFLNYAKRQKKSEKAEADMAVRCRALFTRRKLKREAKGKQ
jgi:hypothetical protein